MVRLLIMQVGPHGLSIIQSSSKMLKTKHIFGFQLALKIWSRTFIHLFLAQSKKACSAFMVWGEPTRKTDLEFRLQLLGCPVPSAFIKYHCWPPTCSKMLLVLTMQWPGHSSLCSRQTFFRWTEINPLSHLLKELFCHLLNENIRINITIFSWHYQSVFEVSVKNMYP
jgi:hypothetical protein